MRRVFDTKILYNYFYIENETFLLNFRFFWMLQQNVLNKFKVLEKQASRALLCPISLQNCATLFQNAHECIFHFSKFLWKLFYWEKISHFFVSNRRLQFFRNQRWQYTRVPTTGSIHLIIGSRFWKERKQMRRAQSSCWDLGSKRRKTPLSIFYIIWLALRRIEQRALCKFLFYSKVSEIYDTPQNFKWKK